MRTTIEDARTAFLDMFGDTAMRRVEDLMVYTKQAQWVYDPDVEGTFGLILTGTNDALVVMYGPQLPWNHGQWSEEVSNRFNEFVCQYLMAYDKGWAASNRGSSLDAAQARYMSKGHSQFEHWAWEDGWLDNATGRDKWHLSKCPTHDTCP